MSVIAVPRRLPQQHRLGGRGAVRHFHEFGERAGGTAVIDGSGGQSRAMFQMLRLSSDDEGDRRVQDGNVAIGVLGAAQHTTQRRRIGGRIAAGEISECCAGKAGIFGHNFKGADTRHSEAR